MGMPWPVRGQRHPSGRGGDHRCPFSDAAADPVSPHQPDSAAVPIALSPASSRGTLHWSLCVT
eukprot:14563751-Alexandrium_andersonii.AAC.1